LIYGQFPNKLALDSCLLETNVKNVHNAPYRGKVRDVYQLNSTTLGIVVSDRISAFDHIMKQAIPFKGQILNKLAAFSFKAVEDIVETHVIDVPHPNVTIARKCSPVPIEVVIRGHLTGHAWREYKAGKRSLCGVGLPDGMVEHQSFGKPILTPATKAEEGHDEDISEKEILQKGIISNEKWHEIRTTAFKLFRRGQEIAQKRNLILVDTKYEFGYAGDKLFLIDEVHTTDSSRYFYADGFDERQKAGEPQKQLSKEFLREWLMSQNFQGLEGQILPDLPDKFRMSVYERYRELFEMLTGYEFTPTLLYRFDNSLQEIFGPYLEKDS